MERNDIPFSHKDEEHFPPSIVHKDMGSPQQEGITLPRYQAFLLRELQKASTQIEASEKLHQALVKQREALEQQLAALDEQSKALEKQYEAWEEERMMLNEQYVWLEHEYTQLMQR